MRMVSANSRCCGSSSVSSSSSVMPMTPFIGVRISWLMLARNSLLARFAASAASLATFMVSSANLAFSRPDSASDFADSMTST